MCAFIVGVGNTKFGDQRGLNALDLMARATTLAFANARIADKEIDAVLCGYTTTMPHLMLATLFCERMSLGPSYAHSIQAGGATGAAMLMLARDLIAAKRAKNILVVAGDSRLTGQSRDSAMQMLAQMGDADLEAPYGATIPSYYGLLASRYMHETGTTEEDIAQFAVLMRTHAASHTSAHFKDLITTNDVLSSPRVASPLKVLDCCPMSDGAVAILVSDSPRDTTSVAIVGAGQAHRHQHVTAIEDTRNYGAFESCQRAFSEARMSREEVDYLSIYDSFDVTLAMLIEELGFAPRGEAAARLAVGDFSLCGRLPLNTHGGLLSFGHSGAAGGMAHVVEAFRVLTGKRHGNKIGRRNLALVHGEGGILSSHVTLLLARKD